MRKVKYGLLAGMAAAAILAMTACGNNQENSGTTTPTAKNTSAAPSESGSKDNGNKETGSSRDESTNGLDNGGGILNEIGDDIESGVDEIESDMGIGGDKNGSGAGNGAGTGNGSGAGGAAQ